MSGRHLLEMGATAHGGMVNGTGYPVIVMVMVMIVVWTGAMQASPTVCRVSLRELTMTPAFITTSAEIMKWLSGLQSIFYDFCAN